MVDSSVWIDFFNGKVTPRTGKLLSLMGNEPLLVGDLILCEILQGARTEIHARTLEEELRKFEIVPMLNPELAVTAAKNYRVLRSEGVTIRKTIDLIIGTFCIAFKHTLLHDDRDFGPMQTHLGLKTAL
ncbi:MAG TPA: PIN domain nuclease [Steroidobacteraceae bacterium]|nr:PIN domain nuclease [Steroidobacteraceae bacterium]